MKSMRRDTSANGSSLELLLDTICNTFGGVVFIALLVILLLQQTVQRPSAESETAELEAEVEQAKLQQTLEALRSSQRAMETMAQELFTPEALELAKQLQQERRTNEELADEIATLEANAERITREAELAQAATAELQRRLAETKRKLTDAETRRWELARQLESERAKHTRDIRLSAVRTVSSLRGQVILTVRFGRLYYIARGFTGVPQSTDDVRVIEVKENVYVFDEVPGRGIPLDGSPESERKVRELLAPFPPTAYILAVNVRADSFEEFRHLRDIIVRQGYDYTLVPCTPENAFGFGRVTTHVVQ